MQSTNKMFPPLSCLNPKSYFKNQQGFLIRLKVFLLKNNNYLQNIHEFVEIFYFFYQNKHVVDFCCANI